MSSVMPPEADTSKSLGKRGNTGFLRWRTNKILDSLSSTFPVWSALVREVTARQAASFIPHTQEKFDPLTADRALFMEQVFLKPCDCFKALYTTFTGLSPAISHEICFRAGGHAALSTAACTDADKESLWNAFSEIITQVKNGQFSPCIVYENDVPAEYAALKLTSYPESNRKDYAEISSLLEDYYAEKNKITRIRQRSSDLRRIVSTALERNVKKYDLQLKQLKDTEKRDKYRIWGELLNTYGYSAHSPVTNPSRRSITTTANLSQSPRSAADCRRKCEEIF